MNVAIVGGGIAGLALALNLRRRAIAARVYERVPDIKELGVGITLLPHATRVIAALGLLGEVAANGVENRESAFFNRFGQLIYKEPRGRSAGYAFPEIGIHRGRLHTILYRAVRTCLGEDAVFTNRHCLAVEQDETGVTLQLAETASGASLLPVRADIAVACDGVNSVLRKQFHPEDRVVFSGVNAWRGVSRHAPIFNGHTYMRVGSIRTGKIVIYPIAGDVDGNDAQLINWTTEFETHRPEMNDWNKPGDLADFCHVFDNWRFEWLDVAEMIRNHETLLEYPMCDKDPIARWTFGRVTLAGDAAHPMYPRGSNGAAQALIDVRTLADLLAGTPDAPAALRAYEQARAPVTARIVRTNREHPPDFINIKVEELTGDKPFGNLDRFITQDELRALSDAYKRVAGFDLQNVNAKVSR